MEESILRVIAGTGSFAGVIIAVYFLLPKVTKILELLIEDRQRAREAAAAPLSFITEAHEGERVAAATLLKELHEQVVELKRVNEDLLAESRRRARQYKEIQAEHEECLTKYTLLEARLEKLEDRPSS